MHWDQNIIFIIIAAIVGISRLIAKISEESKKQKRPPQPPRPLGQPRPEYTQPVQRTQPKTDADRIREFLEALGQPAGTAPPPKIQPRTQIPPRPLAPVQPSASMRPFGRPEFRTWKEQVKEIVVLQQPTKRPLPPQRVLPPAVPSEANEPGAWIAEEQAQVSVAQKKEATSRVSTPPTLPPSAETLWKQILRSPDSVRTAVILREIFGPPRGLQQL
ncbi:MAG: hypothetical protein DMF40_11665 [Verrucomicrobia bacterium]|nr:MAG: hypothetical protein DMF40_11665 [Verrucomicrobiota bacterium]